MRKLFGTDGIRGVAGQYPLDAETVYRMGAALAHHLLTSHGKVKVVIGQDTRESSPWIADTLTAGLESAGAEVASAGVVTTPAIAYLARTSDFAAGIVISASHNPWTDNGIKIFGHDGFKLPDATELEIEKEIFAQLRNGTAAKGSIRNASVPGDHALAEKYEHWLAEFERGVDMSAFKIVVDCANGAASAVAPELFPLVGIKAATFTHHTPNGRNINDHCGALHPEVVAKEVVGQKADMGVCFDGDADRALFADHTGKIVNGDAVLLLTAREMKARGALKANTVVATTMSNMGLEAALKKDGIKMLRAPVGDKYVLEEMQKTGATLGGEQSGHIIFSELATTGDGLLTALKVIEVVAKSGKKLADLVSDMQVYPQVIKNVRVREKMPLEQISEVASTIEAANTDLRDEGRVVVRYSGTEALCRVMIEAASEEKMNLHADAIAGAIRKSIGV
ncbi:MAG TPA: phosphoglucosamine mutase [Terriglobales bacterium]|nr:phosphoglucosamine mutase [Terriglobales bacterium]